MINSAEEFVELRCSEIQEEYSRANEESALMETWLDVIGRYPEMREWVARNKAVPLEILRVLAGDPDRAIRFAVASKRKLDRALFDSLSRDADEGVRQRIAYNQKTPHEILERLSADESALVRSVASQRLSAP